MVDSIDFAKAIISAAQSQNKTLNQTQLQKILYICDGTLLAHDLNIIEEHAQAWDYGPVYPRVLKWYKKNLAMKVSASNYPEELRKEPIKGVIDKTVSLFSDIPAVKLSEWTHQAGSPWDLTVKNENGNFYGKIDKNYMKLWFQSIQKAPNNGK